MIPSEDPAAVRQLAEIIADGRGEIERRWNERARTAGWLPELTEAVSDYLSALPSLLASPGADLAERARENWTKAAEVRGVARVRAGMDIGRLVRELTLLRQVISEAAHERGVPAGAWDAVLADVVDAAIGAAAEAHLGARDREARRRQAEHVAFLTHELRNPLGTAMLTASLLRKRVPAQEAMLEKLERSHRRLNDMIDGVLLSEKLESGTVEPHPSDVSLAEVVALAMENARAVAARRGLAVHVAEIGGASVHVDPLLTRTAIQNLVESAIRYARLGEVDVTVEARADAVLVHVRNQCPGVSPDELRTMLEPFEGGAGADVGAGLGLVIARRAAEAQGGLIHAEPESPSGCHFWIELPREVAHAGAT
jgi:signal transduction histidine kinase